MQPPPPSSSLGWRSPGASERADSRWVSMDGFLNTVLSNYQLLNKYSVPWMSPVNYRSNKTGELPNNVQPCSQDPPLRHMNPVHTLLPTIHFYTTLHLRLGLLSDLFPSRVPTWNFYAFLISLSYMLHDLAIQPPPFSRSDGICPSMHRMKLLRRSLSPSYPNILLSAPESCPSLRVTPTHVHIKCTLCLLETASSHTAVNLDYIWNSEQLCVQSATSVSTRSWQERRNWTRLIASAWCNSTEQPRSLLPCSHVTVYTRSWHTSRLRVDILRHPVTFFRSLRRSAFCAVSSGATQDRQNDSLTGLQQFRTEAHLPRAESWLLASHL
jgi:hypothetical protein